MAAKRKLTDEQVKEIRRRVRKGERLTDLAVEFGVDRKTIRRRLDDLERAETERAERLAAKRLRWQAARERRRLVERNTNARPQTRDAGHEADHSPSAERSQRRDPYLEWLDRPKTLSGRTLAEANGLVRVRSPDNIVRKWVERSAVDGLFDEGWTLA